MPDNSFEREVLDRLIKIDTKLESWDNSKKQILSICMSRRNSSRGTSTNSGTATGGWGGPQPALPYRRRYLQS